MPHHHLTYRLASFRLSPIATLHQWRRGDGLLIGPIFYRHTNARGWMQRHLCTLQ